MDQAYFSPGNACRDAIINSLNQSLYTIKICVFTISDDRITRNIISRHRLGTKIRIITDNDKCYDHGSDIEELAKAGIDVRVDKTPYHMHHKFAIIDEKLLINGSYNWTRSAADFNHENIVLCTGKSLLQSFNKEFERIWEKSIPY